MELWTGGTAVFAATVRREESEETAPTVANGTAIEIEGQHSNMVPAVISFDGLPGVASEALPGNAEQSRREFA
ncbi:MAG: hypothetical protein ACRDV8_06885 [Acidimicrobiales bacterium]